MDIRFINVEHSIKFKTVKDATRETNRIKMVMDRFAKSILMYNLCKPVKS